ncbi:MAG TPA: chemotaxis protein CheB [Polyangia bacterium]|nr:chemotaxis protein CheB [Polyangia bacterium]
MTAEVHHHDIVVVGASAGGVEALGELVAGLPADLPAAVFVVQHISPGSSGALPELLSHRGPLSAAHAIHGEPIVPGRIYVAPPDNHLTVRPGFMHVVRGPRENGHRPSVDALFRTASTAYGPRVIGVVLTGYLDCGTAGLLSIKARGGKAIVQDPGEAAAPTMPMSAIQHAEIDHIARLRDIPRLLGRLAREPVGPWPAHLPGVLGEVEGDEPGVGSEIVCPTCQGRLTETEVNGFQLFRCHVGHAFSMESVAAEQAEEVERALWAAARALEESATLAGRLAGTRDSGLNQRFAEKAEAQMRSAELIRRILLSGGVLARADAREAGEAAAGLEHKESPS